MDPIYRLADFLSRVLRVASHRFEAVVERRSQTVRLAPADRTRGRVVLFYLTDPWKYPEQRERHYHTNRWECATMADTFLEAGYAVDVVDYQAKHYRPPSDCVIAIDSEHSFGNFAAQLPADCLKIYHAPTSHWLHWNPAELRRLAAIRDRRGVALRPRRQLPPNPGIEIADLATYVGNRFTAETYTFAGKPMHRIPISTVAREDVFPSRDIDRIRQRFIWFGSVGLAHKGLDLALEAFARMPDLELTVAGAISLDRDFVAAYDRELNHTPNIHNLGWIDVTAPSFQKLMRDHLGVVYPSCSEGGAGSVICCMHSGVIPVVTYEASIDTENFGILTGGDSVDDVIAGVRRLIDLPEADLLARSRAAWEHVRRVHTRENFRATYRRFARVELKLALGPDTDRS
ncbi:MAG: glycosyltransferase [Opitutaceae bacterium]|nr:glycosyltransferase [Opitutaceae bacterium]